MVLVYCDIIRETIATEINVSIDNKVNPQSANKNRILSQMSVESKRYLVKKWNHEENS